MAAIFWSLIFIIFDLIHFSKSDSEPGQELVTRLCRENRVSNESNYIYSYGMIVADMEWKMSRFGYGFGEMGDPPDRLYVYSQCMGDLSSKECMTCFGEIKQILSSCFPATGGRISYGGCYMRAENYSFFNHVVEPDDLRVIYLFKMYLVFNLKDHSLFCHIVELMRTSHVRKWQHYYPFHLSSNAKNNLINLI